MPATKYNHLFSILLLNSIYPLSKPLNKYLANVLVVSQFKKGDYIVKNGEFCDRIHIIRKGLVRGFFNHKGKEITTWVSVDNEMVTSISGYFKKQPALENIQCLEDTYTESFSHADMHFALENFKEMAQLNRILMEHYYLHAEYRAFMARIPTAKDRYKYYLDFVNPEIVKRLPNKYLASLLNMRPETLSRIKQQ
ncbi:Crp/Fnr family transcriptional regulator [Flavobacteriaceae bacterium XHP0103]|uniref:Crp/Fnr family transcriptional regulator n=1 Tax=Marixanthotalea marina TaxID=2844359 RepID=UPI002989A6DE|nr:Crp/Fnr family transcriptional regulator [Marixanthotalea marina]MBU3822454.1 Crp/Fnr family transcriptional regulator [Marixanthotalea marina]